MTLLMDQGGGESLGCHTCEREFATWADAEAHEDLLNIVAGAARGARDRTELERNLEEAGCDYTREEVDQALRELNPDATDEELGI